MTVTERLQRITQELNAIALELRGEARGRVWQPGPRTKQALDITRAYLAKEGGKALRMDCCYNLIHNHHFGRSAAHEHMARLIKRGLLLLDATGTHLSLPDQGGLQALL